MMRKIELRSSDLEDVSCTEMVDLETLQLGSDNLVSLDVSKCSRLVHILLQYTHVTATYQFKKIKHK